MVLAVIDTWDIKAGAIVLVLTAIGKLLADYRADRKEREAGLQRLQVLRDIATSNAALVKGQAEQSVRLEKVVTVNAAHHSEIIRALNATCKARPIYPPTQQNNMQ